MTCNGRSFPQEQRGAGAGVPSLPVPRSVQETPRIVMCRLLAGKNEYSPGNFVSTIVWNFSMQPAAQQS